MHVFFAMASSKTMRLVCGIILGLCLVRSVPAQEAPLTPGEFVQLWLTVYPEHLDQAVHMTTLAFRQGVSKKDWVDTQGPLLQGLRMQYGKGQVLYEDIQGNEARVIMRVRLSSWMGDAVKEELYSLKKGSGGLWFVDRVDEYVGDMDRLR